MTNFDNTTYTISETADKLNLSEKTLRRWEEAGRFTPSRTVGNQRRYSIDDLQILDAIKHNLIPHQKDLLTLATAAQFLGVTEATIDRLTREGTIHPFITVNTKYYPRHRLLPLLDTLKPEPQESAPIHPTPSSTTPLSQPTSRPAPQVPPLPVTSSPSLTTPAPYPLLIANIVITLTLLTLYHLLFRPPTTPVSPATDLGSVQGAATNPSLRLLDDMLDSSTGGLTASTITSKLGTITPNLTLLPGISPTSPFPGSLYYDASENVLKIYTTNGWQAIATSAELSALKFDLESKVATTSPTTIN